MIAMTARKPDDDDDESSSDARAELRIDAALKAAYRQTAEEPIPDRFQDLLAKLKEQGSK